MFVGRPPGNYARLLDVSRATTGTLFFVPSLSFLEAVTPEGPAAMSDIIESSTDARGASDGSLGIGSLKGKSRDE